MGASIFPTLEANQPARSLASRHFARAGKIAREASELLSSQLAFAGGVVDTSGFPEQSSGRTTLTDGSAGPVLQPALADARGEAVVILHAAIHELVDVLDHLHEERDELAAARLGKALKALGETRTYVDHLAGAPARV